MIHTHKTHIKAGDSMSDLINENHLLLLLLQHLRIDFAVGNKSVAEICQENNIGVPVFLAIANLYNGFYPVNKEIEGIEDLNSIVLYLKNSHVFYQKEKYPKLKDLLAQLSEKAIDSKYIKLLDKFFSEYIAEVFEHLQYEEEIAFPYFNLLINTKNQIKGHDFSVKEYREHHTDIETKLSDLKNLLIQYVSMDDFTLRREFLNHLFELELDLKIHSIVEERILLPTVELIENNVKDV